MRQFFSALEDWVFDDESVFIGIGKLLLCIAVFALVIAVPVAWYEDSRPSFTIQKSEWNCTSSHQETRWVHQYPNQNYPITEEVCDSYVRK